MKHSIQLLIVLLMISMGCITTQAATITVNTLSDVIDNTNGDCTLREAITAANNETAEDNCAAGSGADVIEFAPGMSGTIALQASLPVINSGIVTDLTISGPGRDDLSISGEATWRVISIANGNVSISGVTITNGYIDDIHGGGIDISNWNAVVTLSDCRISNNHYVGNNAGGGGIYNAGTLSIDNCLIENNSANVGGGIYSYGYDFTTTSLTITDSVIRGNSAVSGGGVYNHENGQLTIIRTEISDNHAGLSGGGGIKNTGAMLIQSCRVESNHSDSWPAAIDTWLGETTIERTVIHNNYSLSYGFTVSAGGTVFIKDSTISGNYSTDEAATNGGLNVVGAVSLTNTTISNNTGEGIRVSAGTPTPLPGVTISYSTITGNAELGIRAYNDVTLLNSIVANNGQTNCDIYDANWVIDLGWNIDSDNSCWLTQATDQPGIDPLLGPLQDNDGYSAGVPGDQVIVPTHLLFAYSPAIDAGDNTDCPAMDQRGTLRPVDGDEDGTATCDIGAVEQIPRPYIVIHDDLAPIDDRSIPFGNVDVGSSREVVFTLINQGMQELEITDINLSNQPVFSLNLSGGGNPCIINTSVLLAPSESCTFAAVFTPTSGGLQTDAVVIASNDPVESVVTVSLSGSGKTPPQLSSGTGSFEIAENIAIGTEVTALTSTDEDGDVPSYSIESGNDAGHFVIDAATGVISVAATLDYETTQSYALTVKVDDGNGGSDSGQVVINITDVNESPSTGGGGGGGCSLHYGAPFDPLLPGMMLMACLYLLRTKSLKGCHKIS